MISTLASDRNTCEYKLGKTVTFRRASVKRLGIYGTNLQNPSKNICELYHADPGKLLCQIDQSGADAKIVAWLCSIDSNYRKLFIHGVKPHVFVALHLFLHEWELVLNKDLEYFSSLDISKLQQSPDWKDLVEVIKDSDNWPGKRRFYFMGKKTVHSSSYGMRPPTFRMDLLKESEGTIVLSNTEAARFLSVFHTLFPEIQNEFQEGVKEAIRERRYLRTFQGFPRYFGKHITDKFWREAYAFIPAATVACITGKCLIDMQWWIEDNDLDWHTLNEKHDSIMVEGPEDEIMEVAKKGKEFMCQTLKSHRGEELTMGSGICVGYNWKPYHEKKNPNGLKEIKI